MRKVLMVAGFFRPHKGGTERFVEEISGHLSRKCSVTILTTNTEKASALERMGEVEIIRLPATTLFSGAYPLLLPTPSFFLLLWDAFKTKYDIMVTHTRFFETTFLAYWASLLLGMPLYHVEHGSAHILHENKILEALAHAVDHAFGHFLLRRASGIAAVSDASCAFLRHLGTGKEIEIVPNFVDTTVFDKNGKSEKLTVTYVGRLIRQKGIEDLLTAWTRITERFDARLLIVGEGEERKRLEDISSGNVLFLGEKDPQEVARILAMTDVFVNPSLSEGFSSSVLEACACGLPVIATNVGGTREIIEEEWLVPPRDACKLEEKLLVLLGDGEKRRNVGERNRRMVKDRYTLEVAGRKFEGFIGI